MPLPVEVDSLDNVPESIRDQYAQQDGGKYRLDIEGYEDPKGLKSALEKERSQKKEHERQLREMQKQFEGIDPEQTREMFARMTQDEDSRLIAEGKVDEVVNKRTERMQQQHQRELEQANQKAEKANNFANRFRDRVLSDEIRSVAGELGLIDSAKQDAIYRAKDLFEVNDEGEVVPKEDAGFDGDGKPLTPKGWLESMRDSASHWFPQPTGTGAPGSSVQRSQLKRSTMSAQQKADFQQKHGQSEYLKLPK